MKEHADQLMCWLCSFTLSPNQTRVGILIKQNAELLPVELITLPLPRVDAELLTILELLKEIDEREHGTLEIGFQQPSISYRLLRRQLHPTAYQQELIDGILNIEVKRLCPKYQTVSIFQCPYNKVGFLNNFQDKVKRTS